MLVLAHWGLGGADNGRKKKNRGHERLGFNPRVRKILWRREWHPTPVFLPEKFLGQRSLVGYRPWGCKESDTTKWTYMVGDEGGDLTNEISALIKETLLSSLTLSSTPGHKKFATWKRAIARPSWSQTSSLQNREKHIPIVYNAPSLWHFVRTTRKTEAGEIGSWYQNHTVYYLLLVLSISLCFTWQ